MWYVTRVDGFCVHSPAVMADAKPAGGADLDKDIADTVTLLENLQRTEAAKGVGWEKASKAIEKTKEYLEVLLRRKREAEREEEAAKAKAKKEREEKLRYSAKEHEKAAKEYEKAASEKARETLRLQREKFAAQKAALAKRRPAPAVSEHVREKKAVEMVKRSMNEWLAETKSHAVRSDFWEIMDPEARKELSAHVSNPQLVVMACARAVTEEHIVDGLRTGQIRPEAVSREFRAKFSDVVAAATKAAAVPKARHVKILVMRKGFSGDTTKFIEEAILRLNDEGIRAERVGERDRDVKTMDGLLVVNFIGIHEFTDFARAFVHEFTDSARGFAEGIGDLPPIVGLCCGYDVPVDAPHNENAFFVRFDEEGDNRAAKDKIIQAAHHLLGIKRKEAHPSPPDVPPPHRAPSPPPASVPDPTVAPKLEIAIRLVMNASDPGPTLLNGINTALAGLVASPVEARDGHDPLITVLIYKSFAGDRVSWEDGVLAFIRKNIPSGERKGAAVLLMTECRREPPRGADHVAPEQQRGTPPAIEPGKDRWRERDTPCARVFNRQWICGHEAGGTQWARI